MPKTATRHIPEGMQALTPHIVCADANGAMDFYARAFGAEEAFRLPGPDGKLMHGTMTIAGGSLMLTDENPQWGALGPKSLKGSPVTLHVYVEDADAFAARAVEAGCKTIMPVDETFWGDRYGVVEDPYGHRWSIATQVKDMTEAEVKEAMAGIDFDQACPGTADPAVQ